MKIAFVVFGDLTPRSGGFRYDCELAAALERAGHQVRVVSQHESRTYMGRVFVGGMGLIRRIGLTGKTGLIGGNGLKGGIGWFRHSWQQVLLRESFDLVVADELNHSALALSVRSVRERMSGNPPWVAVCHHLKVDELGRGRFRYRLTSALERRFLTAMDGWVCNSNATARRVQEVAGVDRTLWIATPGGDRLLRGDVTVAEAGEDADRPRWGEHRSHEGWANGHRSPGSRSNERPSDGGRSWSLSRSRARQPNGQGGGLPAKPPLKLIYAGAVVPHKGLHRVLEAMAPVANAELIVAGSMTVHKRYARRCIKRSARVDLAGRVRFLGSLSDGELSQRLGEADVLTLVSRVEGFGIVYLEAMNAGCAVVAGNRGGAVEIVQRGGGRLVDPDSGDQLREAIQSFADDRDYLAVVQKEAGDVARSFPGWQEGMNTLVGDLETWIRNQTHQWNQTHP